MIEAAEHDDARVEGQGWFLLALAVTGYPMPEQTGDAGRGR
jgi:hypothetical protein